MRQAKDQHCPEVEKLLYGKTPFVTRHGITIVLIVIIVSAFLIIHFGGKAKTLFEKILIQTADQIRN